MTDQALVIIDMQVACIAGQRPRHDIDQVIEHINRAAAACRNQGTPVIHIQHQDEGSFSPGSDGWQIDPRIDRSANDMVFPKTACDAFYQTDLADWLADKNIRHLAFCGCATDFCVDTSLRAALSHGFGITILADAHSTSDRADIPAAAIIAYHNNLWAELVLPGASINIRNTSAFVAERE